MEHFQGSEGDASILQRGCHSPRLTRGPVPMTSNPPSAPTTSPRAALSAGDSADGRAAASSATICGSGSGNGNGCLIPHPLDPTTDPCPKRPPRRPSTPPRPA